jgi:hypothetical protein
MSAEMEETQEGRDQQSKPVPDLSIEKVRSPQHLQVETDKLPPRGRLLALWGRRNTMTLEDVPHGLITDLIAQMF